jgi:NitT/TauT family transport system ATP-binding protein
MTGEADYVVVDRLGKTFNPGTRQQVEAVAATSFTVKAGEFVSLLGPSGCGKSTLLMMIAGLDAPSQGAVSVAGRAMTGPRAETGIMFQDPTLLPWKSAIANVLFPFRAMNKPVNGAADRAAALLDEVGLGGFHRHKPRQLSGGMRQRVALARALIMERPILLMDEPFAALDAQTKIVMQEELLRIFDATHKTILFVTHAIEEAILLGDEVVVMTARPGRIKDVIAVDLPRPRSLEMVNSKEFGALFDRSFHLIREEVTKSMEQQTAMDER